MQPFPSSDPQEDLDPALFGELEREIPLLFGVRKLAYGLDGFSWFAHLGEPPSERVRRAAAGYLDRLGFADVDLAILPGPDDAAAAAETEGWAAPAWEAEELMRAEVIGLAAQIVSEEALEIALKLVAARASEGAKLAMEEEGAIWDIEDEAVRTLAVGAAVQASTSAALALLAAEADPEIDLRDHLFTHKLKLFELGRWPVSVVGQSFSLF